MPSLVLTPLRSGVRNGAYSDTVYIFRVDMFIHQRWLESRLEIPDDIFEEGDDYVTLLPEVFENFWQPDPYFLNSKIAGTSKPT